MASIYDRRWKNAQRVWKKFMMLQQAGYMIFDEDQSVVAGFVLNEKGCYTTFERNVQDGEPFGGCFYFLNDRELDNGMMTPIKEWNAQFDLWTFINPLDKHSVRDFINGKS